ncbi:MAG: tRNA (cytidine(34)-2'-O)-methyltransferase [Candidatus Margulisbacteria bacterium]|jgi:tRNA (cytidine/uridine-2'-O-)-methyltransferase|nr:tRNA (cytidine(34)-2'-O)-methyltransferase [Candidatus Margulisiibacteriota bacterium]
MNIVLVEPEIPPNTGNIARLCAGVNATLHLVKPLGFDISDRAVKRAGLDYWDKVRLISWDNLEIFLNDNSSKRMFFFSTKARQRYADLKYQPDDYLVFGRETRGLPESLIFSNPKNSAAIPLDKNNVRSLNLSNSVAIVLYEALRQQRFKF